MVSFDDLVLVTPSTRLSPSSLVGAVSGTAQLTLLRYDYSSTPSITWSSSNPAVATVDSSGLVTYVAPGTATITATTAGRAYTVTVSTVPTTPTELFTAINSLSGGVMLGLYVENIGQTVDGGGHLTAWDDAVTPGAGKHLRPGAELPAGPTLTSANGGTNAVVGQIDLPSSTGWTGGALFHADPFTSADTIPGSSGLYKIFSDRTAGLTIGGVAKLVDGRHVIKLGEDAAADLVTVYGDDVGNIQALHVTPQWTKGANAAVGADAMHWSVSIVQTAASVGNGDTGAQNFLVHRYGRDIMQIERPGPTTGALTNLLVGTRRLRVAPGTQSATSHHRCLYIMKGTMSAAQTKLFCDWADARWADMWNDTNYLGVMFHNSYGEVAIPGGSPAQRQIVEGDSGAPAIPGNGGLTLGTTVNNFWGHRPQHLLYPFYYFLAGCDFSKRPATASVLINALELINATGITSGTPAVLQNFFWWDAMKALDPARVRIGYHDLVYCCSTPFDQKAANVPLLTDYLATHAIPDGHAEVFVSFLNSVMWSSDPYFYGTGDVNRNTLAWDGIHPRKFKIWQAYYRAIWELLRGVNLSNRTIEVFASSPHVDLVGIGGNTTPTWTCKNYLGATLVGKTLSFTSDDPSIATVNASTGQITAVSNGDVWINAISNDGAYGACVAHVTGAVVTEIIYLQNNITGGDASILAYYSTEYNVTTPGTGFEPGKVQQWDDARGSSGYGPSLTISDPLEADRPDWDGTNKLITFDGANDFLTSAASSKFDLSGAKALIFVAALRETTGTADNVAIMGGSYARFLAIRQAGGSSATITAVDPDDSADSTITVGTTRRLVIASKNGTNTHSIEVPNHAKVSTTAGGSQSAGNNSLTIGSNTFPLALKSKPIVRAVVVLDHVPDATEVTAIKTWATTYHGAVMA